MKKVKILALLSAVVTAILVFVFLSSVIKFGDKDNVSVITAVQDIGANIVITNEMLTTSSLPSEAVLPGAITKMSDIVGQTTVTDIYAGEQILSGKLIQPGETGGNTLAYAIDPGKRAISIGVDNITGLAGLVHPGDLVDLLCEYDIDGTTNTDMVAESIKVLAVDDVMDKGGKAATGEEAAYTTLTLEVTPAQAMRISMAAYNGPIRAIMRSPLDTDKKDYNNITLDSVKKN